MSTRADLETIYGRLAAITPGQWQAVPQAGSAGWLLTSDGQPLPPSDANARFIAHAVDDLASLAVELEELRSDNREMREELIALDAYKQRLQRGIIDISRIVGGGYEDSNIDHAFDRVLALTRRVEQLEAAIRAALARPKSDEAIQALSRVLHQPE